MTALSGILNPSLIVCRPASYQLHPQDCDNLSSLLTYYYATTTSIKFWDGTLPPTTPYQKLLLSVIQNCHCIIEIEKKICQHCFKSGICQEPKGCIKGSFSCKEQLIISDSIICEQARKGKKTETYV